MKFILKYSLGIEVHCVYIYKMFIMSSFDPLYTDLGRLRATEQSR